METTRQILISCTAYQKVQSLVPFYLKMYMLPLGNILKSHNVDYHMYADDTQLYTFAHPDNLSSLLDSIGNSKLL